MDLLDSSFTSRSLLSIAANTVKHNEIYFFFFFFFQRPKIEPRSGTANDDWHRTASCSVSQDAKISSAHLHSCAHPFETHVRKYTRVHPLFPNKHTLRPLHILYQSLSEERKEKKRDELLILLHSLLSVMKERRPSLCECECIFYVNAHTIVCIHTFSFSFIANVPQNQWWWLHWED